MSISDIQQRRQPTLHRRMRLVGASQDASFSLPPTDHMPNFSPSANAYTKSTTRPPSYPSLMRGLFCAIIIKELYRRLLVDLQWLDQSDIEQVAAGILLGAGCGDGRTDTDGGGYGRLEGFGWTCFPKECSSGFQWWICGLWRIHCCM